LYHYPKEEKVQAEEDRKNKREKLRQAAEGDATPL